MTLCTNAKGAQCVCQPDALMFCPHDPQQHQLRKIAAECGAEEHLYGQTPPRLVVEFTPPQLNSFAARVQAGASDSLSALSGYERDHERARRAVEKAAQHWPELHGLSPENAIDRLRFLLLHASGATPTTGENNAQT